jgi:hypothetical protein
MTYLIEYDPQGIITSKVEGQLTLAIVQDLTRDLYQLAKEKDCQRILTDLREAKLRLSMVEVYNLPKLFSEVASTLDVQTLKLKRALLAPPGESLPYFYEDVLRNRMHNMRLFYDEESARRWLLEK